MFPLKNTEAYIHANGYRSTLGKELAARDAEITELGSEIQALTNYVTKTGVKNFLPLTLENLKALNTTGTWTNNVYSQNGATIEVVLDSNNSVTGLKVNGTPSADVTFKVGVPKEGDILTGCPSGGGWSTYVVFQSNGATDIGSGASGVLANVPVNVYLVAGNAFSNLMFYPMVRDASITDPTYQPYAKTNVELTQLSVYYNTSNDSISLPTGTEPEIINISNLPAGVYIVSAMVRGYPNTECDKYVRVLSSNESNIARSQGISKLEDISISAVVNLRDNNGSIAIKAYQNSGSTITLEARLDIVRVG